uniref:Uncharacterized protein n=1 Tax=Cajanus cajan TaxID=3821 RepID=A0A151T7T8_CAJCA|nr:hypothetical protein KK1_017684 [Cajanus cajan]
MGNCGSAPKTDEGEMPAPQKVEQQENKVEVHHPTTEEIPVSTHTHSLATLLNEVRTFHITCIFLIIHIHFQMHQNSLYSCHQILIYNVSTELRARNRNRKPSRGGKP